MGLALRLALQELLASKKKLILLSLCLAVGVAGVAAVASFTNQVDSSIEINSRLMFGGDVAISDVRSIGDANAFTSMPGVRSSSLRNTVTAMASLPQGNESALVTVTAADDNFPLLPQSLRTDPQVALSSPAMLGGAFVSQDLMESWDLSPGSRIKVAGADFVVQAAIVEDLTRGSSLFALGPAVIMRRDDAAATGLLDKTSRYRETLTFLVNGDPEKFAESLRALSKETPSMRVTIHNDTDRGPGRVLANLGFYLSQVSLSTFLLVCLGLATSLSEMLRSKRPETALYRVLGAKPRLPLVVMLAVVLATCLSGTALGVFLGEVIRSQVLLPFLQTMLPFSLAPFEARQIPVLLPLWGALVPILFVWPLLKELS